MGLCLFAYISTNYTTILLIIQGLKISLLCEIFKFQFSSLISWHGYSFALVTTPIVSTLVINWRALQLLSKRSQRAILINSLWSFEANYGPRKAKYNSATITFQKSFNCSLKLSWWINLETLSSDKKFFKHVLFDK